MTNFLSGWKTYIAALLAAFVAFNSIWPVVSQETQNAVLALAGALGLVGVRHAIAKVEDKTEAKAAAILSEVKHGEVEQGVTPQRAVPEDQ